MNHEEIFVYYILFLSCKSRHETFRSLTKKFFRSVIPHALRMPHRWSIGRMCPLGLTITKTTRQQRGASGF